MTKSSPQAALTGVSGQFCHDLVLSLCFLDLSETGQWFWALRSFFAKLLFPIQPLLLLETQKSKMAGGPIMAAIVNASLPLNCNRLQRRSPNRY